MQERRSLNFGEGMEPQEVWATYRRALSQRILDIITQERIQPSVLREDLSPQG
jgi:hypothetical protein